jgi:nicotinate phosphoribosyltransferase
MPYVGRDEDYEEPLAAPSAMWTDLYELTMAQALFFEGMHNQESTFHAFVRSMPYKGAYLVTAGQNIVFEWLDKNWQFTDRDIRRLEKKVTVDATSGKEVKIFRREFLDMLKNTKLELSVEAMPEGEIAFPMEPVIKITGPLWQCLAVETAILNAMNSQSNFATYAAMLKTLANDKPVIEFGLRRAQAVGGLSPTRGAYIGGVNGSSNCWAETNYGINTIGTMAHAYVMVHDDELDAFEKWAEHNPHLGIFLVDTYNTLEGVKRAIEACNNKGIKLAGVRLDSGDLAYLSKESRKLLDAAGFQDSKILVSNGLDASTVESLELQGAPIDVYAVGTSLATAADQPALGGVYKVANIYDESLSHNDIVMLKKSVRSGEAILLPEVRNKIRDLLKLSEEPVKMTYPGELDLIRYLKEKDGKMFFDGGTIYPEWAQDPLEIADPSNPFSGSLKFPVESLNRKNLKLSRTFNTGTPAYRPIVPFFNRGELVGDIETVHLARNRTQERLAMLDPTHKRRLNPHEHVVGVERSLSKRQDVMADELFKNGSTVEANELANKMVA